MNRSIDEQISHVLKSNYLTETEMKSLCQQALIVVKAEQNVMYLNSPIVVCGSIRGQFQDLLEIFNTAGQIPDINYLFLGDFTTHGFGALQCISLLLLYKIRYPSMITLLRGKYESRNANKLNKYFYNLLEQCKIVYRNEVIWNSIYEVYESLPLAAIINNEIFCQYGGLSPTINTIEELQAIDRFMLNYFDNETLKQFFIGEPIEDPQEWVLSYFDHSIKYGKKQTENFLENNKLKLIICCAQYLLQEGIQYYHDNQVLRLTSAPNWLYCRQNLGAAVYIDDKQSFEVIQFEKSENQEEESNKFTRLRNQQ